MVMHKIIRIIFSFSLTLFTGQGAISDEGAKGKEIRMGGEDGKVFYIDATRERQDDQNVFAFTIKNISSKTVYIADQYFPGGNAGVRYPSITCNMEKCEVAFVPDKEYYTLEDVQGDRAVELFNGFSLLEIAEGKHKVIKVYRKGNERDFEKLSRAADRGQEICVKIGFVEKNELDIKWAPDEKYLLGKEKINEVLSGLRVSYIKIRIE